MTSAVVFWITGSLLLLVSIPFITIVSLIAHLQYRVRKYGHLPSPKMLPHWSSYIFGHANQLDKLRRGEQSMRDLTLSWVSETGPVFVVHLFQKTMVTFLTKESVKEFVASGNHYKAPSIYKQLHSIVEERFMGRGLVTEYDEAAWGPRRNLFNPAFHRSYLKLSMDQFNKSTDLLLQRLAEKADGKTEVRMLDEISRLTMDIIAKVGFGYDCESLTKECSAFNEAITCALKAMSYFEKNPWKKISPLPEDVQKRREVRSAIKFLRTVGKEVVEKRIQSMMKSEEGPNDILSYILKATNGLKNNSSYGMLEVMDEFATFFVAGMETNANTLSSLLMLVSRNEEVMVRLKEEVHKTLKGRTNVEFEDLAKLEYMAATIKEVLRLNPPTGGTVRLASYDVECNGHLVPKGSMVVVSLGMGRLEEYFPEPLKFKPERFLDNSVEPHTWIPFMVGPRSCLGQQFAMMEMKVIMAKLLQTFDLQWVPGQSYDIVEETTMKPKDGALHYLTLLNGHVV